MTTLQINISHTLWILLISLFLLAMFSCSTQPEPLVTPSYKVFVPDPLNPPEGVCECGETVPWAVDGGFIHHTDPHTGEECVYK